MMTDEDFTLERGPWVNPILKEGTCLLTLLCYSHCIVTREGDITKSEQPFSPEKVRCFHSQETTWIQWHLVVCRPECRRADQQGASSPLHHAANSGATAADREECMGKGWAGRIKIRECVQGCLCFHFRYLNWGNTRFNSLTCTQKEGHQWVENIWEKALWLPGL